MASNRSHVSNKTAKDRAKEYPGRVYCSDNLLFCHVCEVTLDYRRKSTIDSHMNGAKHVDREKQQQVKSASSVEPTTDKGNGGKKRQVTLTAVLHENASKKARTDLVTDIVQTFTYADIPLEKLNNPHVRTFLEKHVVNGRSIPSADYLRRNKVQEVYEMHMDKIKVLLNSSHSVSIITDETTDCKNRAMLNTIVVPVVSKGSSKAQPYLIDTVEITAGVNGTTVAGAVLRSLAQVGIPYEKVVGFVTDNVAYMGCAFGIVHAVIPSAIHVGCWAHIFSLVGDQWRKGFPEVDQFVAAMKKLFKTSRKKKMMYIDVAKKEGIEKPKAPPQPVLSRWNSWLLAVKQHSEYFDTYPALIEALEDEGTETQAFETVQEFVQTQFKELALKLKFIAVLSEKISNAVDLMESRNVSAHTIYNTANNLLIWLKSLELTDYETKTREEKFNKESAKKIGEQFHKVVKMCRKKLELYMNGKQPAINFLKAVRVFDVTQVGTMSGNILSYSAIPQLVNPNEDLKLDWNIYLDKVAEPIVIDNTIQLISFWHDMMKQTPRLASIALSCLSVPTTSVDVERSFSVFDNILDDKRQNLTTQNLKFLTGMYFNAKALA